MINEQENVNASSPMSVAAPANAMAKAGFLEYAFAARVTGGHARARPATRFSWRCRTRLPLSLSAVSLSLR